MEQFEQIRPYHDHEVRPTLKRLLADKALLDTLVCHRFPRLPQLLATPARWTISAALRWKVKGVNNISGFQALVKPWLTRIIERSSSGLTVSGLDHLAQDRSYLFLSNHRDIVMDPALVNLAIHRHGLETLRIAIGDNLLQRPFVNDLMRLNKSFVVQRSVNGRREKLNAFQTLSDYIRHSINTGHPVWLAQSEGRAKDGNDRTDTAIIKMLGMSYRASGQTLSEAVSEMNLVPVSISYEYDPCDCLKAAELSKKSTDGFYQKTQGEDLNSIVEGIEGFKGRIHVAFTDPVTGDFDNAADLATQVDQQIHRGYRLFPANLIAWHRLNARQGEKELAELFERFAPNASIQAEQKEFEQRLTQCPKENQPFFLAMYANPLSNFLQSNPVVPNESSTALGR